MLRDGAMVNGYLNDPDTISQRLQSPAVRSSRPGTRSADWFSGADHMMPAGPSIGYADAGVRRARGQWKTDRAVAVTSTGTLSGSRSVEIGACHSARSVTVALRPSREVASTSSTCADPASAR